MSVRPSTGRCVGRSIQCDRGPVNHGPRHVDLVSVGCDGAREAVDRTMGLSDTACRRRYRRCVTRECSSRQLFGPYHAQGGLVQLLTAAAAAAAAAVGSRRRRCGAV